MQQPSTEWKRQSRKREEKKKPSFNQRSCLTGCYNWLHGDGERETGRQQRKNEKKSKEEQTKKRKQNKKNGGQQGKRGPEVRRAERLKRPFVQQFVDAVADLPQRESVLLSVPVQLGQEVAVGEMVEDVVDARVRARR